MCGGGEGEWGKGVQAEQDTAPNQVSLSMPFCYCFTLTYLQSLAELAGTHTQVDQHLKHAVVRLASLLPKLTQHVQRCLSIVQPRVSLRGPTLCQPLFSLAVLVAQVGCKSVLFRPALVAKLHNWLRACMLGNHILTAIITCNNFCRKATAISRCSKQVALKKETELTALGVITEASRPRGSPRLHSIDQQICNNSSPRKGRSLETP